MKKWTSQLVVDAGNPAVRIDVVDSNFQICARGYNRIDETLPTGIYKVRYTAGDAVFEKLVKLEADAPVKLLKPPTLEFASAAPIEQTHTSHEYHQAHAHELSRKVQLKLGQGSGLFLFVRDLEPGGRTHPMQGMSLHSSDGTQLVDLERKSSRSRETKDAAWAGCTLALEPGTYRLRLARSGEATTEMVVVACPGWQSQVFLLHSNSKEEPGRFQPLDLSSATQLMARPEKGFNPYGTSTGRLSIGKAADDVRLADLAHLAVANQWRGFHTKDLNALLKGKFYDPMLGILGLHLLLMRPEPDLKSAARIHRRLQKDVLRGFPHPDVQALGIEIARLQGETILPAPIGSPPMLRNSWSFLLKATAELPSLIPTDSFCSLVSDRVCGNGAWLVWVVPKTKPGSSMSTTVEVQEQIGRTAHRAKLPSQETPEHMPLESLDTKQDFESLQTALLKFLPVLEDLIKEYQDVEKLAKKARLNQGEYRLLSHLRLTQQMNAGFRDSALHTWLSLDSLVRSLGIPADRIQTTMTSLLEKLRLLVKPRR